MTDKRSGSPKGPAQANPTKQFRTLDDIFDSDTVDTDVERADYSLIDRTNGAGGSNTGKSGAPVSDKSTDYNNKQMDPNKKGPPMAPMEGAPAPTGMLAWVGFGCCIMALACLSIAFCSPYWLQTWPMSENKFKNIGLWQVCFHDYMQFKDDSQQTYDGCWWVFDGQTKYYKLREWLIPRTSTYNLFYNIYVSYRLQ